MITLGLSGGFGHDAAACVIRDGEILALIEEERVIRFKGAYGQPPVRSAVAALRHAGLSARDVDVVAFGWDPALDGDLRQLHDCRDATLAAPELRGLKPEQVAYLDHHLCHATTALAATSWTDAAVIVVDGRGERAATSLYRSTQGDLELVAAFDVVDSLGSFFSAATRFAGFSRGAEGKLMGLASYGSGERLDAFSLASDGYQAAIPMERDGSPTSRHRSVRARWLRFFEARFGPPRNPTGRADDFDRWDHWVDFAACVQATLNDVMRHLCEWSLRTTGRTRLAISGGVGLNCAANGELRQIYGGRLSLYGCMGDAGTALGAALHTSNGGRPVLSHAYLGESLSDDAVRSDVARFGLRSSEPQNLEEAVAELLCDGKVVGWCQGRAEVGPRALGHRSILANAADPGMSQRVNSLKGREQWRPLAPSVASSDAAHLYGIDASPYMLEATPALDGARRALPACVHVDGTSRVHTPTAAAHPRFHALLDAMSARTGTAACLNTSFNIGPEPIVNSATDALRAFFTSELDALALGPLLIEKDSR